MIGILQSIRNLLKGSKTRKIINTTRRYLPGTVISGTYSNYKKDQHPIALVLYCGKHPNGVDYTHAININAINPLRSLGGLSEQDQLRNLIFGLRASYVPVDMRNFYENLKTSFPNIIKYGYRTYFTSFLYADIVSAGFHHGITPALTNNRNYFVRTLNELITGQNILEKNVIKEAPIIDRMRKDVIDNWEMKAAKSMTALKVANKFDAQKTQIEKPGMAKPSPQQIRQNNQGNLNRPR